MLLKRYAHLLPLNELERLEVELGRMAEEIRQLKRRRHHQELARHRARNHRKRIREIAWILADQVLAGRNWDEAIRITSHSTGTPSERIEPLIPLAQNHIVKTSRARRNRQIMQMVAKGYTNADIGERVGMHEKSISRIINDEIRRS